MNNYYFPNASKILEMHNDAAFLSAVQDILSHSDKIPVA